MPKITYTKEDKQTLSIGAQPTELCEFAAKEKLEIVKNHTRLGRRAGGIPSPHPFLPPARLKIFLKFRSNFFENTLLKLTLESVLLSLSCKSGRLIYIYDKC